MIIPFKKYTIEDLRHHDSQSAEIDQSIRSQFKISCIDDNRFDEIERLALRGYELNHHLDIVKISQVEPYEILLCDIDGVGLYRDGAGSGVDLMKKITETYPHKYIIGYSGLQAKSKKNRELIDMAKAYSDSYVFKQANIPVERWVEVLDNAILTLSNPYQNWKRIRNRIILRNPDVGGLDKVEDYYVRYVLSRKKTKYREKSIRAIDALGIAADSKELFGGLMTGLVALTIAG